MKQTQFELRAVLFFLVIILLLLGSYTQKKYDENVSLKSSLKLLESSIDQEKKKNELQLDSLQQLINVHDEVHLQLLDSLEGLGRKRLQLNNKSNENKAAIAGIRDVDSLRNAIARHYLQ